MKINKYLKKQITFVKEELINEEDINTIVINVMLWEQSQENEKIRKQLLNDGIIGKIHHNVTFNDFEDFMFYWQVESISETVRQELEKETDKIIVNFYGTSEIKDEFDIVGFIGYVLYDDLEEAYIYYCSDKKRNKKNKELVLSE